MPSARQICTFNLDMCFARQRRAFFGHLNFQKWSDAVVFCTFWLGHLLRAQRPFRAPASSFSSLFLLSNLLCSSLLLSILGPGVKSTQFLLSRLGLVCPCDSANPRPYNYQHHVNHDQQVMIHRCARGIAYVACFDSVIFKWIPWLTTQAMLRVDSI